MSRPSPLVPAVAVALALASCMDEAPVRAAAAGDEATRSSAPEARATPDPALALPADPMAAAHALAQRLVIVDTHIDVPYRLEESRRADGTLGEDIANATAGGDFDYPRARAGGLDVPFLSIYVPARFEEGGARKFADSLIDLVEGIAAAAPDKFAIVRSPEEVRRNVGAGRMSIALGMENGSPIESKLESVAHFRARGIRYITLAHSKDNHLADSSYDDRHTHHGLSEFGRRVVGEMNRLGIMVDVSHLSDDAFWQVLDLSTAPVIASHSSCRKFTPDFERNLSDEMIVALAQRGGVVQINFGSDFLDDETRRRNDERRDAIRELVAHAGLREGTPEATALADEYESNHPAAVTSIDKVADHIDHVIDLAGVDHVGLGSDFDGVGDSLPSGLEDVSAYPNLIRVLLERGHTEVDLEKICGGNLLRVWQAVEDRANAAQPTRESLDVGERLEINSR